MGVIRASQNDATFRRDGEAIYIHGDKLMASAKPFFGFQSLNLECLPNRDSLVYGEKYGIESAQTIFRGSKCYAMPLTIYLKCCISFSDNVMPSLHKLRAIPTFSMRPDCQRFVTKAFLRYYMSSRLWVYLMMWKPRGVHGTKPLKI